MDGGHGPEPGSGGAGGKGGGWVKMPDNRDRIVEADHWCMTLTDKGGVVVLEDRPMRFTWRGLFMWRLQAWRWGGRRHVLPDSLRCRMAGWAIRQLIPKEH